MYDKIEEFSVSGISTSGAKCDTRSSASDPSCIDNTLLPITCVYSSRL